MAQETILSYINGVIDNYIDAADRNDSYISRDKKDLSNAQERLRSAENRIEITQTLLHLSTNDITKSLIQFDLEAAERDRDQAQSDVAAAENRLAEHQDEKKYYHDCAAEWRELRDAYKASL